MRENAIVTLTFKIDVDRVPDSELSDLGWKIENVLDEAFSDFGLSNFEIIEWYREDDGKDMLDTF